MGFEAVLFDLGGVFTPSPFEAAEKAGADMGAAPGLLMEIVFGPYHEDTDHPWHCLERGETELETVRGQISELGRTHGLEVDLFAVLASLASDNGGRQVVIDCVREVRAAGLHTALVTNNIREFGDAWKSLLPVDELFDAVADSCLLGVRKPDPAMFEYALAELGGVDPTRAVFLDDFAGNIDAARRMGMHAILVETDPEPALAELRQVLAAELAAGSR
ncbi:MAG TPA: HAD family phosphatase [Deltaproteobacteria bacterium]|nr:HAD family phosphatase [Candidatus Binatota bacterium]HIL13314.1 HAD family phosphatase [Deltaproteobacteria bacterium]